MRAIVVASVFVLLSSPAFAARSLPMERLDCRYSTASSAEPPRHHWETATWKQPPASCRHNRNTALRLAARRDPRRPVLPVRFDDR